MNPERIMWSASTMAVDDSLTTVTLGQMHGSCLPLISIFLFSILEMSTEDWHFEIEGVGLTAILETIGIPLVMPPIIPPELFVLVFTLVQILVNICEATKQEKELFKSR